MKKKKKDNRIKLLVLSFNHKKTNEIVGFFNLIVAITFNFYNNLPINIKENNETIKYPCCS